MSSRRFQDVFKTSWKTKKCYTEDVFTKTNVCWEATLNEKVTRINCLLNLIFIEKGFIFIDNRNINIDDLWEDGLHLIKQGKVKLAQNFIHF